MAMIGIDIGGLHSMMATIQNGSVQVVRNELADRLTPTLVGFTDKERLLGDAALSQIKSNLKNTCNFFKNLVGSCENALEKNEREKAFALSKISECDENGILGYEVNYKGKKTTFSAIQVIAAYIAKLRRISEKAMDRPVGECVISCPVWYTEANKAGLIDASRVAGMNCVAVIPDVVASATDFGFFHRDLFSSDPSMNRIAFVSIGHTYTYVSIIEFRQSGFEILTCSTDRELGGRDIDLILAKYMANDFKKNTGLDAMENPKNKLKLMESAQKLKHVLSANQEGQFFLECLMDEKDCSGALKREQFEEMCSGELMPKLQQLMERALGESGLGKEQLAAIEILGGCSRIPWIQNQISSFFGKAVSKRVNCDESVARGCCCRGAMLSTKYRSMKFDVVEKVIYPVDVCWGSDGTAEDHVRTASSSPAAPASPSGKGENRSEQLFVCGMSIAQRREVVLYRSTEFNVSLVYSSHQVVNLGVPTLLGVCTVKPDPSVEGKLAEYCLTFSMASGFVEIESVTVKKAVEVEETWKEKRLKSQGQTSGASAPSGDDASGQAGDGSSSEGSSSSAQNGSGSGERSDGGEGSAADGSSDECNGNASTTPSSGEAEYEYVKMRRKVTRDQLFSVPFIFNSQSQSSSASSRSSNATSSASASCNKSATSPKKLEEWTDAETAMQADDREEGELREAMNNLEGYIYEMRNKLSSFLSEYADKAEKDKMNALLNQAEDWLLSDASVDASKVQFDDEMNKLLQVGDPICNRLKEREALDYEFGRLGEGIKNWRVWVETKCSTDASHVSVEKRQEIIGITNDVEKWMAAQRDALKNQPKHENPSITSSTVSQKLTQLHQSCTSLSREPAKNHNNGGAANAKNNAKKAPTCNGGSAGDAASGDNDNDGTRGDKPSESGNVNGPYDGDFVGGRLDGSNLDKSQQKNADGVLSPESKVGPDDANTPADNGSGMSID